MDLAALQRLWPMLGVWSVRPNEHVANNYVQRVDTSSGSFILRYNQHHHDASRVRYEHGVVGQLQRAALPFRVPAPIPTTSGASFERVEVDGREVLVSLWPFVRGAVPDAENLEQARTAGRALAELDEALADVQMPLDITPPPSVGELRRFHPLVPDPMAAVESLPVDEDDKAGIEALFREMLDVVPQLYGSLPQQIIHNDYDPSNVLMEGDSVTGVLDFEFSTEDVRVMDLVVALLGWAGGLLGSGQEWKVMEAIGSGYIRHSALRSVEMEALPQLFKLRSAASLIHRIGRYAQGLNTEVFMVKRVASVLHLKAWVESNQAKLLGSVQRW